MVQTKMVKFSVLIIAFSVMVYLKGFCQLLDVNISVNKSVIEITVENPTNKKIVIGLQNWQIIPLTSKTSTGVALPSNVNILNFVFMSIDPNWSTDQFYLLDWELNFDSIPEKSLKILEPKVPFKISVVVDDSNIKNLIESKNFTITYIYSTAKYRTVRKHIKQKQQVFLMQNTLLISDVFCNNHYIEKPSGSTVHFYNKEKSQSDIEFSKLSKSFMRQIFSVKIF